MEILILIIPIVILYFIIMKAVKRGIIQAYYFIEADKKTNAVSEDSSSKI